MPDFKPYLIPPLNLIFNLIQFIHIAHTRHRTSLQNTNTPVVISGNSDCVELLIAMGACLESYDLYYGTPLHVACLNKRMECAKVLLNAGELH